MQGKEEYNRTRYLEDSCSTPGFWADVLGKGSMFFNSVELFLKAWPGSVFAITAGTTKYSVVDHTNEPLTITYDFAGEKAFSVEQQTITEKIFRQIESIVNLKFHMFNPGQGGEKANIVLQQAILPHDNSGRTVYATPSQNIIEIDPQKGTPQTIAHEILHALGFLYHEDNCGRNLDSTIMNAHEEKYGICIAKLGGFLPRAFYPYPPWISERPEDEFGSVDKARLRFLYGSRNGEESNLTASQLDKITKESSGCLNAFSKNMHPLIIILSSYYGQNITNEVIQSIVAICMGASGLLEKVPYIGSLFKAMPKNPSKKALAFAVSKDIACIFLQTLFPGITIRAFAISRIVENLRKIKNIDEYTILQVVLSCLVDAVKFSVVNVAAYYLKYPLLFPIGMIAMRSYNNIQHNEQKEEKQRLSVCNKVTKICKETVSSILNSIRVLGPFVTFFLHWWKGDSEESQLADSDNSNSSRTSVSSGVQEQNGATTEVMESKGIEIESKDKKYQDLLPGKQTSFQALECESEAKKKMGRVSSAPAGVRGHGHPGS